MAITVVSTTPADGVTGHYLDHSLFVQFSKEIEGSYLDSDFFKLYRTNETRSQFYEFMAVTVTKVGAIVQIDPTAVLQPLTHYIMIIVGGTSGIRAIDNDTLAANVIFGFKTAETVAPQTGPPVVTPEVDLWRDGDPTDETGDPSHSLFADQGDDAPIALVSTFPQDKTVGVDTLARIICLYNDTVDPAITIPTNALNGRWTDLPLDLDPFGDRRINCSGVVVSDRQVIFDTDDLTTTTNREYIFTLAPGVVRGTTRRGYDAETHTFRFMGPLSPVYASPEQILKRITGWDVDLDATITEYDIWKLILEASLWVRDVYQTVITPQNLILVNRLTICMVLRDLFIRGMLLMGGVKSRSLLAVKVEYFDNNWDKIAEELEKCIRESIPPDSPVGGSGGAFIGVKSGKYLSELRGEQTKMYGVYR